MLQHTYTIAVCKTYYPIHVSGWNFDPKPKFRSEPQISIRNPNFDLNPKFPSETPNFHPKPQISIRNPKFPSETPNFDPKANRNFVQKSKFWSEIEISIYTIAVCKTYYPIHVSGWNFDPKPKFQSETQISIWTPNFGKSDGNLGFGWKFGFRMEIWGFGWKFGVSDFGWKFGVSDGNLGFRMEIWGFGWKFGVKTN